MTVRELQTPCRAVALGSDLAVAPAEREAARPAGRAASPDRFRRMVDDHYDFLWRTLRYFGVPDAFAEDATQQVLCIVARRLGDIAPGAEMSFLFSTAMRVASQCRRSDRRHPATPVEDIDDFVASCPTPEELVDTRRAQEVLRQTVQAIPVDLRVVFVLFEIEELTLSEISECIGVPMGTVASRLRRAREKFTDLVRRRVNFVSPARRER